MNKADKNTTLWENVKIIFDEKCINLFNNIEPDYKNNCMKGLTLNDCLRIAKENSYKEGIIRRICLERRASNDKRTRRSNRKVRVH